MQSVIPAQRVPSPLGSSLEETCKVLSTDIDRSLARLTQQFQQFVVEERKHRQQQRPPLHSQHTLSPFQTLSLTPLHERSNATANTANNIVTINNNVTIVDLEAQRRSAEHRRREEQKLRCEAKWREVMRPGGPRLDVLR